METIFEAFKRIAGSGKMRKDLLESTSLMLKYLDKASNWLDDISKHGDMQKITDSINEFCTILHGAIAEKFRKGEWGPNDMEQVHRLTLMLPFKLTEEFETFIKSFYDRYYKKS